MAIEERLEYTEKDAKEIFDRMSRGIYSKVDLIEAGKYLGVNETEATEIIEKYDKEKVQIKEKPKKKSSGDLETKVTKENPKKLECVLKEVDWERLIGTTFGALEFGCMGGILGGIPAVIYINNSPIILGALAGVIVGAIFGASSYHYKLDVNSY